MTNNLIQVYSDIYIHLWNKIPEIEPSAKYLFLAGNICQLNNNLIFLFFDYCSKKWEKVFYIPGNTEFYSQKKNYQTLDFEYNLKIREKYKNIFYLNDTFISLNDEIDIYGSIFWPIPLYKSTYEAKSYIDEFTQINYFKNGKNIKFDLQFIKELSDNSVLKLKEFLNKSNKKIIILTHFPPFYDDDQYQLSHIKEPFKLINTIFSWKKEIIDQIKITNIVCWICGHTRYSYDIYKFNCNFISNQVGYKKDFGTTNLKKDGLFII
jgi:predicted phosphohydrolase